jgi:hypothetical protein
MTLYKYSLLIPIRAFPSEGRTAWVRRYCNLAMRVLRRIVLPINTSMYVQVRKVNLTSQITRQARFPRQNVIPHTEQAASLIKFEIVKVEGAIRNACTRLVTLHVISPSLSA